MAKSKYKVKAMDELPTEEQLAMEKASNQKFDMDENFGEASVDAVESTEDQPVVEEVAAETKPVKVAGFRSNRYKQAKSHIDRTKMYSLSEAIKLLKSTATAKFDESVEVHLVSKESLGTIEVAYPHSTGKVVKVAILNEDVIEQLNKGVTDFDVLVASPADMKNLTKFARLLGPKGLMPNPKNGTLVADPAKRAKELTSGKTSVRSEKKAPLVHTTVGKISMDAEALEANIRALLNTAGQGKVLKAVICTSMSPGVKIAL